MKFNSYKCDICAYTNDESRSLIKILSFRLISGREMDASGNGYNTIFRDVDLCQECIKEIIQKSFDKKEFKLINNQ